MEKQFGNSPRSLHSHHPHPAQTSPSWTAPTALAQVPLFPTSLPRVCPQQSIIEVVLKWSAEHVSLVPKISCWLPPVTRMQSGLLVPANRLCVICTLISSHSACPLVTTLYPVASFLFHKHPQAHSCPKAFNLARLLTVSLYGHLLFCTEV